MGEDFDPDEFLRATLEARGEADASAPSDPFDAAQRAAAAQAALTRDGAAEALIAAARARSPEAHGLLLQGLNELCLKSGRSLTERETALVFEIFGELLDAVETDVRAQVSDSLADRSDAPRELVLDLARDAIAVAEPVLTRSVVLSERDLAAIVEETPETHQLAVTQRPVLSEEVTSALARAGTESVLAAMLQNANANVGEEVMLRIAENADDRPALHAPLANRRDLPMRAARRLHRVVDDALKATIERRLAEQDDSAAERTGGRSDGALSDALADAEARHAAAGADTAGEATAAAPASGGDPDDLMNLGQDSPNPADKPHPRLLVKALTEGDHPTFETLFGEFAGLDPAGVERILQRAGPEALAIACKGGGMSKRDFGEVLSRVMDQDDPTEAARTASFRKTMNYFERIDAAGARRVLEAWR